MEPDENLEYRMVLDSVGFVSTHPLPSVEILSHHYANKYYQKPKGTYSQAYSPTENLHRSLRYQVRLKAAELFLDPPRDTEKLSAIDIGCGEGFFLSLLQDRNYDCLGLDYSAEGITKHNPLMIQKFIEGNPYDSIDRLIYEKKTFDLINAGNVLEHVLDVEMFLKKIKALMSVHSVAIISVPNDTSSLQELLLEVGSIDRRYFFSPPEHLQYFNADSLLITLKHFGLHVVDLLGDFPIEWFLANEKANYVMNSELGTFAHAARITIENYINGNPDTNRILGFWRALAALGMGRVLTAICKIA